MNHTEAKQRLEKQMLCINQLQNKVEFSPEFKKWFRDTEVLIEKIFGENTRHSRDFANIQFHFPSSIRVTPEHKVKAKYREGLEHAFHILASFMQEINDYGIDQNSNGPLEKSWFENIRLICDKFHNIAKKLSTRYGSRTPILINDEYDVQDLFHALLVLYFDDIRAEEWTPSYGGRSSRVDFLLKEEQVVIEIKKTRKGLGSKELGEQLIIDIHKYRVHPDCKYLICFVYDPESIITNPKGIETDLSEQEGNMKVKVIIKP